MKKIIIILFAMFIILTGCGENKAVNNPEKDLENENKEAALEVDKKLLSVDIRLPIEMIEEEGVDIETTLEEIRKTEGINKVTLNNDGTVTYNMTKNKHNEMMQTIEESLMESSNELLKSPDNSIVKIENSKDYTLFEVYVDPSRYNEFELFTALSFYIQGIYYNAFNGNSDAEIIVKFINNDTNEIIEEGSSKALTEQTTP